jgi:hypothetical protein
MTCSLGAHRLQLCLNMLMRTHKGGGGGSDVVETHRGGRRHSWPAARLKNGSCMLPHFMEVDGCIPHKLDGCAIWSRTPSYHRKHHMLLAHNHPDSPTDSHKPPPKWTLFSFCFTESAAFSQHNSTQTHSPLAHSIKGTCTPSVHGTDQGTGR